MRDKYEGQYYCPECNSKNIRWFKPTWTKNGYHQCKDCNYKLTIGQIANQRHYLRNIKPIEDENRRIDFANEYYDFIIWIENNHKELIEEFKKTMMS